MLTSCDWQDEDHESSAQMRNALRVIPNARKLQFIVHFITSATQSDCNSDFIMIFLTVWKSHEKLKEKSDSVQSALKSRQVLNLHGELMREMMFSRTVLYKSALRELR